MRWPSTLVLAAAGVALAHHACAAPAARNEVVLAMSQFKITFSKDGKKIYTPGNGKVWVLHPDEGWRKEAIPHRHSLAVHKARVFDIDFDGANELVVVGGTDATILAYERGQAGWSERVIWRPKHLRVRDVEMGDVDGDGQVELVVATHDRGVVAVLDYADGAWRAQEVHRASDTRYVHEIEMGDVDGDGVVEFFANPSQPNVAVGVRQPGQVLMFKWDGRQYRKTVVEDFRDTHTKELLVADLYHDGRPRLIVPAEGIGRKDGKARIELLRPMELREHTWTGRGRRVRVIAAIEEVQCRSLAVGDVDHDGRDEIVAGCKLAGLYVLNRAGARQWRRICLDPRSTAAVHAVLVADVDGDGDNEILSASDDTDSLDLYEYVPPPKAGDAPDTAPRAGGPTRVAQEGWASGAPLARGWRKRTVLTLPPDDWVWTIEWGDADNR